ncbi:hypothetical protein S83_047900 [Arachis hypogaea]
MFVGIDVCFVEVRLSIFRGQFSHVLFIQIKTMFIIAFRFMVIKGMIKGCPYLKIKLRWWKRSIIVKKKELISPLPKPQQEEQGEKEEPPKKEEPHQPPQENKDQVLQFIHYLCHLLTFLYDANIVTKIRNVYSICLLEVLDRVAR